jgi:hypothetical protein
MKLDILTIIRHFQLSIEEKHEENHFIKDGDQFPRQGGQASQEFI